MRTVQVHSRAHGDRVAYVDDADYPLVAQYHWYLWTGRRTRLEYAMAKITRNGTRTTIKMHVLLTGNARTDHWDGNGLNNQRRNLRECTQQQNMRNSRPHRGGSSRYKGVTRRPTKRAPRWQARIKDDTGNRYLGTFADEAEAARAYDAAAREAFGEFAALNFKSPGGARGI